jgi:hypothetical protein
VRPVASTVTTVLIHGSRPASAAIPARPRAGCSCPKGHGPPRPAEGRCEAGACSGVNQGWPPRGEQTCQTCQTVSSTARPVVAHTMVVTCPTPQRGQPRRQQDPARERSRTIHGSATSTLCPSGSLLWSQDAGRLPDNPRPRSRPRPHGRAHQLATAFVPGVDPCRWACERQRPRSGAAHRGPGRYPWLGYPAACRRSHRIDLAGPAWRALQTGCKGARAPWGQPSNETSGEGTRRAGCDLHGLCS